MPRLSIFNRKLPLSLLTASQLLDIAEELLDMAETASTPGTRHALNRVAALYIARAAVREQEELAATRH